MFQLNDKVVYPGHGVAIVEDVIKRCVAGVSIDFLKLNFLFKDMNILVPLYNVDSIGLRAPSNMTIVETALKDLGVTPKKKFESIDFSPSGWNKRNKEYQMKIQSGKLADLVSIYRDLMHISQIKDLSFGERALLQNIEDLIVQEIKIVKNIDRELVVQEVRDPFKQFFFQGTSVSQEVASAA